jgi:Bacterial DNA polymerase III alpha NTPase domain
MKYDQYGQSYTTEAELFELLYQNPELDISRFQVEDAFRYNDAVKSLYADVPQLRPFHRVDWGSAEGFDRHNQSRWYMPTEYKNMDIAQWILDQCQTDAELQRVGEELLLYIDRDLIDLLRYLKYFVDTMRANNIVWGLGRGSSVASYVLYLMGVHKINSIYYDLDIREFLK